MSGEIISRDAIKRQARAAVDAGIPASDCPYLRGSDYAKRWYAAYLMRECELNDRADGVSEREEQIGKAQIISTFSAGPVEHHELVTA